MDVNYVIEYLKRSNKYLEETLMDGFVNETTIKYFPLYFFEYFAMNKEAQKIVMSLTENNLKILSKIITYADKINQDWIPLCAEFYHFLKNNRYSNLVNEISNRDIDESLIENLLFVCKNGGNYFNINSIEELIKFDSIRLEQNNRNSDTNDPNILLLNKYGISYDKAYNLYKRYGKDVSTLPDSIEKKFLLDIKNIIEGKGTEKNVYEDKSFIISIDSVLRNYFSKIYNDSFYMIDERKRIGIIQDIPIYDAGVNFNMCIYSYGMATDYPIPQNYKEDWNRPKISTYYMCNSIINSWNMKTHVKHCVYGFNYFGRNELALLGANDLGTGGIYNEVNVTNPFHQQKLIADVEFRLPNELINNTRFTNNEVYRLRRRKINGKLERINPDYIVYFKKEENFQNDSIWKESINAAKDFGVPIVIIDCEKCLINNIAKIEKCLELFESRFDDSQMVSSIIEMIYMINSGYRDIAPELLEKHFDSNKLISYVGRIAQHIDEISVSSPKTSLESINVVLNTLNNEFEKVLKSPYWVEYARKQGYIVDKPHDIINLFETKRTELQKKLNYNDTRQQTLSNDNISY